MSAALPLCPDAEWRPASRRRRGIAAWMFVVLCLAGAAGAPAASAQTDGALRWPGAFRLGQRSVETESSPAVGPDGTIYIGVAEMSTPPRGRVVAVQENGTRKWESEQLPHYVDSSPALSPDGSVLYIGCWDGKLYALNTANGAKRWEYSTGLGNYIVSSPAVGPDGTVYVGAGDLVPDDGDDSGLYALRPDGTLQWRRPMGDAGESSPAIAPNGTIYIGSKDQNLYAIRPDGSERWRFTADSPIWSSPAIGPDGTVYIGSLFGRMYAIRPDGTRRWDFASGGAIWVGAAVGADGSVYFGSADWSMYALSGDDGSLKWSRDVGQVILTTPAVRSDGTIIFGANDRWMRALDSANGAERWSLQLSYLVRSSPVVARGSIYVAASDGFLYALHSPAVGLSAYSSWPMFRGDAAHRGRARTPVDGGRLINLATRATVANGTALITGFVVRGTNSKEFLLRAIGPALEQFGVSDPLQDPTITLRAQRTGELLPDGFNDNWSDGPEGPQLLLAAARVGAFPLPIGSRDAALVVRLDPGAYTATVGTADGRSGVALVEAYDAAVSEPGATLVNLSTRGSVPAGGTIIPGLVIGGSGPLQLLIRAVGPGLAQFGVTRVLARPTISVYAGQEVIRSNTGWTAGGVKGDIDGAARLVGAFPLAENSADSALLTPLAPGIYTILVAGLNGSAGEVLVEVYTAP